MDPNLTWRPHISNLIKKLGLCQSMSFISLTINGACVAHTNGLVLPQFDYRDTVVLAKAL